MTEIGRRFKQYRIFRGFTQEEISNKSGVSLLTVQKFENGADVKMSTLNKLLNSLDLKIDIDSIIPDVLDRPSSHFKKEMPRKRMRRRTTNSEWRWGEDR